MQSDNLSFVIAVLVVTSATTGCSSRSGNTKQTMAPQGNDSFSAGYNESPPAPLAPAMSRLTTAGGDAPPAAAGSSNTNAGGAGYGDRHVRVNVPLVHVNVDRDSGGVHIDAPFVHINKRSRYDSSEVSIPDRASQSEAVSQNGVSPSQGN
jgi:hypothetical protein